MTLPRHRSRSMRRVQRKTPGGRTKTYYRARKPKAPACAECKKTLQGIPRMSTAKSKNAPKSRKTVSRAYGGFLCAECVKKKIRHQARNGLGIMKED